jgi:transposase-like protein
LRWSEGTQCPFRDSKRVIKRGVDAKKPARQRYECKDWGKRFDDLIGTIFAAHHQPLKIWFILDSLSLFITSASAEKHCFIA